MGRHIGPHLYEHDDGRIFGTGCLAPKHPEKFRLYAEAGQQVYDRPTLVKKINDGKGSLAAWVVAILNQSSHPWCWAFSATGCMMSALALAGYEKVILDPTLGPFATGVDDGNAIDAMIQEVQVPFGAVTAEYTGNDPVGGDVQLSRIRGDWKSEAAKRKVVDAEWLRLEDVLSLASALVNGHPCCWGVDWQGGGHALQPMEVGIVAGHTDKLYIAPPNTWGLDYDSGYRSFAGRPGWAYFPEDTIDGCWDGACFGAYALCGVKDSAEDILATA